MKMMTMVDAMPLRNFCVLESILCHCVLALLLEQHFEDLSHSIGAVHMVPKTLNLKYEGNLSFLKFLSPCAMDIICCHWKPLLIFQQHKAGHRTLQCSIILTPCSK